LPRARAPGVRSNFASLVSRFKKILLLYFSFSFHHHHAKERRVYYLNQKTARGE